MLLNAIAFPQEGKLSRGSLVVLLGLNLFLLPLFSTSTCARLVSQQQQKESLGSLSSLGEVYVNDIAAPAESTIFSGDRVRTGDTGTATFAMSGKGTLKISPRSEVVFTGNYQFTGELKSGTVLLSSTSGPGGITLRVENFVLVSSIRQQSATSKIEPAVNGAYLISCLDGGVGVLTLEGKSGRFLQAGQTLSVSSGEVILPSSSDTHNAGRAFHSGWLYLGLAGAGTAAIVAESSHGGKQSISPSGP